MKCSECHYFSAIDGDDSQGYCHRYPPIPVKGYSGIETQIPEVGTEWWCGEFRQKCDLSKVAEVMKQWQDKAASECIVESTPQIVIHGCPKSGESVTSCCNRNPFELSPYDRLTIYHWMITCDGGKK